MSSSGSSIRWMSKLAPVLLECVEVPIDVYDLLKLLRKPNGVWFTGHPPAPASNVQQRCLIVLVGKQVDRFQEERRLASRC